MEFPFGHHNRHSHRDEEREEQYPPPGAPPPVYRDEPPQYPVVTRLHHNPNQDSYFSDNTYQRPRPPPPQPDFNYPSYGPPPPQPDFNDPPYRPPTLQPDFNNYPAFPPPPSQPEYPSVQHVSHSHHSNQPHPSETPHETHHLPSFFHHHTHQGSDTSNKRTVRVYCKAETGYSLAIRDGKVILARSDENDDFQHWIKDEKYSIRVKDEEGLPCFALINKATGQAMKHSIGATHPVHLIPYNPDVLDESILWTESKDTGDGYRTIRMVNNIRLNLDAFHGDQDHGGVRDGTILVLWEWMKGENQRWKIVPYCSRVEVMVFPESLSHDIRLVDYPMTKKLMPLEVIVLVGK